MIPPRALMTTTPTPEEAAAPGSLDRALRIVFAIADSAAPDVGVSELSRTLGMPKAVVHRIMKTLSAHGFLAFDERSRRYQLGPGALTVGLAAVRKLDVPVLARPYQERMVAESGETATLSVLRGSQRIYIDQVLSPQEVRLEAVLGRPYPLYAGASSKAVLAALPEAEAKEYLERVRLDRITERTPTDRHGIEAELVEIRRRGYAATQGERQSGAASVAAAVLDSTTRPFGSISVCGPIDRFPPERVRRLSRLVTGVAAELSGAIGHRPPA
jgi:DNA-binding IclR family transcriptional regulator